MRKQMHARQTGVAQRQNNKTCLDYTAKTWKKGAM